jgi:hypothetical protein
MSIALAGLLLASGCATVPRPVPVAAQPLASVQVAGVSVHVPRLDPGDYPADVLDVMTPVLVVIENRSSVEILVNPDGFVLAGPGGLQYAPLRPEQLALKDVAPSSQPSDGQVLLAWRGSGGGGRVGGSSFSGVRSAPAYHGPSGGGIRVGAPPAVGHPGGGFRGSPGYYGRSTYYGGRGYVGRPGGYYGRPGYYGRQWWGWNYPWLWGAGWGMSWYGSPWWWQNQGYSTWTRSDAAQMALPAGRLPPGGRTGGFLYFPKMAGAEGTSLVLAWQIRDSSGQQVLGDVQVPLELSEQQ